MKPLPAAPDEPLLDSLIAAWRSREALTAQSLLRGREAAHASGERLDRVLNKLGLVSDDAVLEGWAEILGWEIVETLPPAPVELEGIAATFLARAQLFPFAFKGDALQVAVADPLDGFSIKALAARTGRAVVPFLVRPGLMADALAALQGASGPDETNPGEHGVSGDIDRLRDLASDAPAIRAIEGLIGKAADLRSSDIHISPTPTGGRVRLRVDGVLRDLDPWSRDLTSAVVLRLKVMASLDIAESRLPQDGRVRIPHRGSELDLRMATMPHVHGEGVVLRLLHRARATPQLEALDLPHDVLAGLSQIIASPNGVLLVTGPTGSGKTTTLYATLQKLARPDRNIITVEDPVEHTLDGAVQVQVDRKIGFDFAEALRAVLRHDPDVVMIGEIRDAETASIAMRAALTGHLVLATVHTNSALAAVPRLLDMGVEPWLLASTLRGTMAQRLVRRLCRACHASPTKTSAQGAQTCPVCEGTGFDGRLAVGEFVAATPPLLEAISRHVPESELIRLVGPHRTLLDDALQRVEDGATTIDEVRRVVGDVAPAGAI